MKRILSLSLGLAVLLAGCITKQPQGLTPIPMNPEMVKLERQMIARMNLPPMPPSVTVQNRAMPKLVARLSGSTTNTVSIWGSTLPTKSDDGPDNPVELGVKFKSDTDGQITGIRFYKSAANTGTHIGNLWTLTGTNLASKTFTNETASGWQQVTFNTPVSIKSNTVYVASYHCTIGHNAQDTSYFASNGFDNPPLHALKDGASGGNGCYTYATPSLFPTNTWSSVNYWVDVVLTYSTVTPTNPPVITSGLTNQWAYQGTNTTLSVSATGTSLSYQWSFNSGAIAGATNTTYTITNVQPFNAGTYSVLVTNVLGRVSTSGYVSVGTTNILTNCLTGTMSLTLAWCPSTGTNGPLGYFVYNGVGGTTGFVASVYSATNPCGPALSLGTNYCRCYTNRTDAGTNLSITITNLSRGVTNCFAATAYDTNALESDFSEEIQFAAALPRPLTNFTVFINYIGNNRAQLQTKVCPQSLLTIWYKKNLMSGSWTALATNQVPDVYGNYYYIDGTDKDASRFYRMQLQ